MLYIWWSSVFSALKVTFEKFPDPISSQGTGIATEEIRDNTNKDNPVGTDLKFVAQTSDNEIAKIAQVASAGVPDQDDPEKYINTDKKNYWKNY